MTVEESRPALTRRRGVIPAVLAGLIAVGAVSGFWASHRALERDRSEATLAVATAQAAVIGANLATGAAVLTTAGQSMGGVPALGANLSALSSPVPAATLGVTRYDAKTGTFVFQTSGRPAATRPADNPLAKPEARLALELARDDGFPVAAAEVGQDGSPTVLQILALYGPGPLPADVAARRGAVLGFVALIEPAIALMEPAATNTAAETSVQLGQGSVVLARVGTAATPTPSPSAPSVAVPGNEAQWTVRAWSSGHQSRVPWVILFGGLALALVGAATVTAGEAESGRLARAATARSNELGLVARMGPLLQQSLDLGELLPLFVIEISDELDLEGVAISLVSESGRLVRAFSLGTASIQTVDDPRVVADLPASVPAGGMVTVPLLRAGRIVGALTARAHRGLDPSRTETLRAVCELLAAALGNARLLQEEQAMVARLRDLDRLKTTFLGSVSHDLRTTVTAIDGFATLLDAHGSDLDEGQRRDFLQRIQRNARSLGALVEDLLDFARLERSGVAVTLQPVDLTDLVPKVVDQMYSILGARPMSISVAESVVARADPGAMERILVNLLSNAAKYTPADTEITVSLAQADGAAVLTVSDRGPGIPLDQRERIFDRFYRIDNEEASRVRGVGIGLALVSQLVELQSGTVVVDDAPEGGARFRVTVPLFETASAARPAAAASSPAAAASDRRP